MQFDPKIRHLVREYRVFCRQNNSVFTQNDREFKNREFGKKFIFQQLGTKIENFADIRRNNNAFTQKKNAHFKTISCGKSRILLNFQRNDSLFSQKNRTFKINQPQESS